MDHKHSKIGEGGYGTVYKVADDHTVVVKVLKCDPENNAKCKAMWGREITGENFAQQAMEKSQATGRHTTLIPWSFQANLHEKYMPHFGSEFLFFSKGDLFVSDLKKVARRGDPIANMVRDGKGDVRSSVVNKSIAAIYAVVNALAAHDCYHCDIKGANVFLSSPKSDGHDKIRPRVGDFGLCHRYEKGDTPPERLCGTTPFMGPDDAMMKYVLGNSEVVTRSVYPKTGRSDFAVFKDPWKRTVYSVLVTLIELGKAAQTRDPAFRREQSELIRRLKTEDSTNKTDLVRVEPHTTAVPTTSPAAPVGGGDADLDADDNADDDDLSRLDYINKELFRLMQENLGDPEDPRLDKNWLDENTYTVQLKEAEIFETQYPGFFADQPYSIEAVGTRENVFSALPRGIAAGGGGSETRSPASYAVCAWVAFMFTIATAFIPR